MRQPIRVAEPVLNGNERDYVIDCLDSTWISSRGKYIEQFESRFADFCGTKYAVATNNGTTALHLALASLGIGPGDEVIVPTLTYIASVNAIRYCGATPVFVDVVDSSMTLDPAHVEAKISDKTKGIVTVPLYGQPVNYAAIEAIAKAHDLFVVDDAAEALGAAFDGKPVGSLGDCATFSFFGNKIITTGEGGMVTTNNPQLADQMRLLRGQGVSPDRCYWHNKVGFNYRMTNIAAAIGCGQLENIESHLERRQEVAKTYHSMLKPHAHLFELPTSATNEHHCYWMYTILLNPALPTDRDAVMRELSGVGIETRPVFYPVHTMPPYFEATSYPRSESCSQRGISLPTHGRLSHDDLCYVAEQLVKAVQRLPVTETTRRAA